MPCIASCCKLPELPDARWACLLTSAICYQFPYSSNYLCTHLSIISFLSVCLSMHRCVSARCGTADNKMDVPSGESPECSSLLKTRSRSEDGQAGLADCQEFYLVFVVVVFLSLRLIRHRLIPVLRNDVLCDRSSGLDLSLLV